MMRVRSSTHSTDQNQRSAASSLSSITNSGVWRRSGQVHWDTCVVCLSTLKVLPRTGFTLWVSPAELRWTHNKIQRQFSCGRRLQDVAASLQQGVEQPSELPMISIVRHEMKWYSRNTEAVMLQSGQSGSGGGLYAFDQQCFSVRSDDTDRWSE